MKRITLLFIALVFCSAVVVGQNADNRWGWSHLLNFNHYDGVGGSEILNLGDASLGYQTGFNYYLNPSFNVSLNLGVDGIDFERIDETTGKAFLSVDYKLNNGYLIAEDAFVKPYLTAGFGVVEQLDKGEPVYPFGAGVRFGVSNDVDIQIQGLFNYVANGDRPVNYNYFQLGAGIVFQIGGESQPKDSDGDGVPNKEDICPDEYGPASNNGCPLPPDSDGDGVIDSEDKCPNEVGPASNGGCPLPKDSDGDGVIDDEDSCPNVAGLASLNGCPDSDGDGVTDKDDACPRVAGKLNGCPDSDGDGIADKDDRCIHEAGPASNNGCPELDEEEKAILLEALEGVQFETGKAIIKTSSYSKLDNVVGLLKKHEDFKLRISGYTDNTGNADKNLTLSDQRAKAAKKYIADKGINASRITAKGYGIENPVATNNTSAGRAKNRRVEFEIIQ